MEEANECVEDQLQAHYHTQKREAKSQTDYTCAENGCTASLSVFYKQSDRIRVQGCLSHIEHGDYDASLKVCPLNHQHEMIEKFFKTEADADNFIADERLDGQFSIRRGYEGKNTFTKVHKCACTDLRYKIKKKTKKTEDCRARFHVKRIKDAEDNVISVQIFGCIAHSHIFQNKHKRLSKRRKEGIVAFSKCHIPNKVIADVKFDPLNEDENVIRDKMVVPEDVRRLVKKENPRFDTDNLNEVQGLLKVCRDMEAVRAINLRDMIPDIDEHMDDTLREKYVDTRHPETGVERFLIVYISQEQRELFRKYPWILMGDGKSFGLRRFEIV